MSSWLWHGQITLETAQDLLQDLLRAHDRRLSMEEIQKRVAEHFKIRISDMEFGAPRPRRRPAAAGASMYLSKQLTSRSLPEIGAAPSAAAISTTVMHAVRKIEELSRNPTAPSPRTSNC